MIRISAGLSLILVMCVTAGCGGVGMAVGAGAVVARSVIQERSTMDALEDLEVQLSLNNRLMNHSGELFGDVSTNVTEGRVVLTGSVSDRENKIAATQLAWETPGVVAVNDELTVAEDAGTESYIEDVWISNQLRFALLTDGGVSLVNYNVHTVDNVVHLTGLARSRTELSRVIDHAAAVPGVARVVSHVLTIDDPRRQLTSAERPATG